MKDKCVMCNDTFKINYSDYEENADNDLNYFCRGCRTTEIKCNNCSKENYLDQAVKDDWWIDQYNDRHLCIECRQGGEIPFNHVCGCGEYSEDPNDYNRGECARCDKTGIIGQGKWNCMEGMWSSCGRCSERYNIGDGEICYDCHDKICGNK